MLPVLCAAWRQVKNKLFSPQQCHTRSFLKKQRYITPGCKFKFVGAHRVLTASLTTPRVLKTPPAQPVLSLLLLSGQAFAPWISISFPLCRAGFQSQRHSQGHLAQRSWILKGGSLQLLKVFHPLPLPFQAHSCSHNCINLD